MDGWFFLYHIFAYLQPSHGARQLGFSEVIPDPKEVEEFHSLPLTRTLPIGHSHRDYAREYDAEIAGRSMRIESRIILRCCPATPCEAPGKLIHMRGTRDRPEQVKMLVDV